MRDVEILRKLNSKTAPLVFKPKAMRSTRRVVLSIDERPAAPKQTHWLAHYRSALSKRRKSLVGLKRGTKLNGGNVGHCWLKCVLAMLAFLNIPLISSCFRSRKGREPALRTPQPNLLFKTRTKNFVEHWFRDLAPNTNFFTKEGVSDDVIYAHSNWHSCAKELHGRTSVIFRSRFYEPSGFAMSSISLLMALETFKTNLFFIAIENDGPVIENFVASLSRTQSNYLQRASSRLPCARLVPYVYIHIGVPFDFVCPSGAYCIGRTAFETSSVPENYKVSLERMHEIWTYTQFNLHTFNSAHVKTIPDDLKLVNWHQFHCLGAQTQFLQTLDAITALRTAGNKYLSIDDVGQEHSTVPLTESGRTSSISIQTIGLCGFTIMNRFTNRFLTCSNNTYRSVDGFNEHATFGIQLLNKLELSGGLRIYSGCGVLQDVLYPVNNHSVAKKSSFKAQVVPDAYNLIPRKRAVNLLTQLKRCDFTFISVFAWNERKDPESLITSFLRAFHDEPDTCLVLRTFPKGNVTCADTQHCHQRWVWSKINEIVKKRGFKGSLAQVIVLADHLTDAEIADLYAQAGAYVTTTHGEGLGKPLVEAMIAGVPIAATNWSAPADFLSESTAYLLNYSLVDISTNVAGTDATYCQNQWAQVDEDHVVETLKQMRHDPNAKVKATRAQTIAFKTFSDKVVADTMSTHLSSTFVSWPRDLDCGGTADFVISFAGKHKNIKKVHLGINADSNGLDAQRHRDNDELRFAVRSVLQHAPWMRKLFLITSSPPDWLDLNSTRLEVVSESELLGYLHGVPTANSLAIEAAVHTITSLHECYIYMNDDYFITKDVLLEDFFKPQTQQFTIFEERDKHSIPSWSTENPINAHDSSFKNVNALLDYYYGHREERSFVPHVPHFFMKSLFKRMPPLFKVALSSTARSTVRSFTDVHTAYMFNHYVMESLLHNFKIVDTTEHFLLANQTVATIYLQNGKSKEIEHLQEIALHRVNGSGPTFLSVQDAMENRRNTELVNSARDVLTSMFPRPSILERA